MSLLVRQRAKRETGEHRYQLSVGLKSHESVTARLRSWSSYPGSGPGAITHVTQFTHELSAKMFNSKKGLSKSSKNSSTNTSDLLMLNKTKLRGDNNSAETVVMSYVEENRIKLNSFSFKEVSGQRKIGGLQVAYRPIPGVKLG